MQLGASANLFAQTSIDCGADTALENTFPSGAQWQLCASLHPRFGLHLTQLHYLAPGDTLRQTFREIHLAGLLEHHHNEPVETVVLANWAFGGTAVVPFNENTCPGTMQTLGNQPRTLCAHSRNKKILAKYGAERATLGSTWELTAAAANDFDVWEVSVRLGEEGTISPMLRRSGRLHRFTDNPQFGSPIPSRDDYAVNTTLLATWRLVPGFGLAADDDQIQQLDFIRRADFDNRRTLQVTEFAVESFARIKRENFRGWRIFDSDGSGYYLDPQNNGFQYSSQRHNWALFDVAVTRFKACEKTTLLATAIDTSCSGSLDDAMSGESLEGSPPVLWYSQSFSIKPSADDVPLLQMRSISFDLLPFDWTSVSPFASSDAVPITAPQSGL